MKKRMAFVVEEITENGFSKVLLKDLAGNCFAAILPGCGAILHGFSVQHNGAWMNVIDHYDDAADFKNNCTAKGFKGCKLSPFVCRLNHGKYSFAQQEYSIEKFYLGKNALHGLLYDVPFLITEKLADGEKASVTMKHEYRKADKGFPFDYDCIVTYELRENNILTVITTLINKDEGLIPVTDGWHPYFTLGKKIDELQLEFQSKEMLEFDAELIPTRKLLPYAEYGSLRMIGDAFFDNCFTLNFAECQPLFVLRNPAQKIQVAISPDPSYPYLQIYTPPHRNSIAIENLGAAPDAFNNGMGLLTLAPGAAAAFKTKYTISSLP